MKNHLIKSLFLVLLVCANADVFSQQIIRTIAGDGQQLYNGDGGPAIRASIGNVYSVAVDRFGNVYSCDNYYNNVRIISPDGMIQTLAGTGYPGYSGEGGPASLARLSAPFSVAMDPAGNLDIADAANFLIRQVNTRDTITAVAGNHVYGYYSGDGIPALSAKIGAAGVGFDNVGNMFIADGNTRVRKVNLAGIISTVAGSGAVGYGGVGGPATNAALDGVSGVCVDNSGNIYIAEKNNNVIRKVTASTGKISTFCGIQNVFAFSGDGGQASAAKLNGPNAVRIDPQGNLVIVDQNNCRIRRVNLTTGIITTIAGSSSTAGWAGDGGSPTAAKLAFPFDVAWDTYGNMFIADKGQASSNLGHRVREVFTIDTLHLTANPGDTICGFAHVTFTAHEIRAKHYLSFYKWKLNGLPVGTDSSSYTLDSVRNGDVITCSIIDSASGGFTIAVSDTIRMVVRPVVIPAVTITASRDTVCNGQSDTFTAHGSFGGPNPQYHWYVFGTLMDTGTVFIYTPAVGDVIRCVLVSNAICANQDSVSAFKVVSVNVSYPPEITLDPHPNDTIAFWGEIITLFSQLTFQGSHPTFQWFRTEWPSPGPPLLPSTRKYSRTILCIVLCTATTPA